MASDSRYYRIDEGGLVAFRRTPKLSDHADTRRFPAAGPRSIWYAVMEQPGWIKTENGLWLPTQFLEQVAPADDEIEVTFTALGPLGLVLLPDSSPVLVAQVADTTAKTFPALVPGIVLTTVQGRSIEGQRCADVVQQLKNSERPLKLTFQQFVNVGAPTWRPGQNIEAARDAVVAVGGQVTQGIGRAFGRLAGGLLGGAGAAEPSPQANNNPANSSNASRTPARARAWDIKIAIPRVVSMTYYQIAVAVGQQHHWSTQKRWSQFVELDAHLRDAFQEDMSAVAPFPQQLLQDSRKGDPGFVEQRRATLESYLIQLLAKIDVLLEYEPFLTFIALTEHIHQLHNGSSADGGDILDSGVKKDKNGTEGGDRSVDDIDSGVFVPSKTSTGSTHGAPVAGMVCAATDMAIDSSNYVEYQTAPSMQWAASQWCEDAVQELIETQFEVYLGGLTITADNAAELSAAMVSGLRVWLCDPSAFPLPMGDTHVFKVWYARDGKERSGRLLQTGPRATRMRRLAEGRDSESDYDEEDEEDDKGFSDGEGTQSDLTADGKCMEEEGRDESAADKRYERLQRLQNQASAAAALQAENEPQEAAATVSSPLPAAASTLPRGRWDELPRIPAAPWQPMSVSGTAALSGVMRTLATSFNAAGVCVGLEEWVGHAVVAVGAVPVLGRAELCWQLVQLPLVRSTSGAPGSATGADGVELTLAPVEDVLAVYGAMCESREHQARSARGFAKLDGLLQVVSDQQDQLTATAKAPAAHSAGQHRGAVSSTAV